MNWLLCLVGMGAMGMHFMMIKRTRQVIIMIALLHFLATFLFTHFSQGLAQVNPLFPLPTHTPFVPPSAGTSFMLSPCLRQTASWAWLSIPQHTIRALVCQRCNDFAHGATSVQVPSCGAILSGLTNPQGTPQGWTSA
mmetsp:Transcript_51509/g.91949  ORF Transcript_51509/g.91949 Transcript_51509/m.91949 type:complete len:138 (-) Transcript_51509:288-701(-)